MHRQFDHDIGKHPGLQTQSRGGDECQVVIRHECCNVLCLPA